MDENKKQSILDGVRAHLKPLRYAIALVLVAAGIEELSVVDVGVATSLLFMLMIVVVHLAASIRLASKKQIKKLEHVIQVMTIYKQASTVVTYFGFALVALFFVDALTAQAITVGIVSWYTIGCVLYIAQYVLGKLRVFRYEFYKN